ncbi:MAG: WecB/TagA/CpsF family glycosyltransferase [Actinomycetota bacterium]|nr:WecB/TagA/CpsF family glycosyltransferase [Actinomycetota bacterium]
MEVLGCSLNALTLRESIERAVRIAQVGGATQHVVVNAGKYVQMEKDQHLACIVRSAGFVNADGMAVVWAARVLGRPLPERVTGIDMFQGLLKRCEDLGIPIYLLGATDEVLSQLLVVLNLTHPNLIIAGWRNGYFGDAGSAEVVDAIRGSGARMLFVGMPTPRKEYWLAENLTRLEVPFCMGVGGSFDVVCGHVRRAPLWMQGVGLEWFYRLVQEPRRMWRRYVVGNATFIRLVAREWMRMRLRSRDAL